jgi:PhnB protein
MVTLNPYLTFDGRAREAMTFYQSVLGGDLTLSTFGESGFTEGVTDPDQLMHATLTTREGITLMAADVPDGMSYQPGDTISISLSGPSEDHDLLRGYFDRLSEGATPGVPLEQAPWGDYFGMLTDRFGIGWMVNIAGA